MVIPVGKGMPVRSQRVFCITHEPPLVPRHLYQHSIGIGDYRPADGTHIIELDQFWHDARPLSYGAAGNYVIPQAVERTGIKAELTGVFSHRKVIVRHSAGRPAAKYPVYREISVPAAAEVRAEDTHPRERHDFLIGAPIQFSQGVILQYAQMHHAIDLFDYVSIAIELKILSAQDVREFTLETWFIPGGCELGIYPTDWLVGSLRKLEAIGREFITRRANRIRTYDHYQVRAVGFLAERLGSYFLLKELRQRYPQGFPRDLLGSLCVILPEGSSYSGATADDRTAQPLNIPSPSGRADAQRS